MREENPTPPEVRIASPQAEPEPSLSQRAENEVSDQEVVNDGERFFAAERHPE